MIVDFAKYIKGYVRVKVWGRFPERMINLCGTRDIYVWDIKPSDTGYIMSISKKGYLLLRPILKKSQCRAKIIEKKGFATSRKKVIRGKFFLYSGLISVLLVFFLSQFLWRIEIEGNHHFTDEQIINVLAENGVTVGSYKKKFKVQEIESFIYDNFKEIAWVSCERKGTQLQIGIKEELKVEQVIEKTNPCDLLANTAGKVVSIVTYKGTPQVEKGTLIEKGDLLISGTLETYEYNQLIYVDFTHASGEVLVTYDIAYNDKIDFVHVEKEYIEEIGSVKKSFIFNQKEYSLLSREIKDYKYDIIEEANQLELVEGFFLPLTIITKKIQPYVEVEKKYSKSDAIKILEENLEKEVAELKKKDIQISRINVVYNHSDNETIASGTLSIVEKTGVEKPFNKEIRRQEYSEYIAKEDEDTP